jgi:hypothetical protein
VVRVDGHSRQEACAVDEKEFPSSHAAGDQHWIAEDTRPTLVKRDRHEIGAPQVCEVAGRQGDAEPASAQDLRSTPAAKVLRNDAGGLDPGLTDAPQREQEASSLVDQSRIARHFDCGIHLHQ